MHSVRIARVFSTPSQHFLSVVYALFHSNPTLPNDPTFNLVLPLIQIGLPLVTLLLYVGLERITREYRPRARTLLILPQKVYRKVQLEVHYFACNIVNRYNRHFVTYYKICSAGLLFSVREFFPCRFMERISFDVVLVLHGPLDYLSLDGRRWISQMATILSLSLGLLLLFFYFAIMNKGGPQPYMISFSPNSGPPSSNSSHECSVPLEVIVVDPARCEIDPVRSGSDNSSTTVGGSTRISTTHRPFLPLSDGQSEQKAEVHNAKAGPSQPGRIPPLPSAMIRLTRVESECGLLSNDTVSTGMTREHSSSMSSQRHSSHSLSAMPNSSPAETHRRDSIYHDPTSPSFSPPSLRDTNSIERVMAPTTDSEQ